MVQAIRQSVTVRPGGVVEVRSDELRPGTTAEVIVLVESSAVKPPTVTTPPGPIELLDAAQRATRLTPDAAAAWAARASRARSANSRRREPPAR